MIEVNGMAHVILTVSCFEESREFYCELLPVNGGVKMMEWTPPPDGICMCQGGVVVRPPEGGASVEQVTHHSCVHHRVDGLADPFGCGLNFSVREMGVA